MPGVEALNRSCQLLRLKPAFDIFARKRYYFFARCQVLEAKCASTSRTFLWRLAREEASRRLGGTVVVLIGVLSEYLYFTSGRVPKHGRLHSQPYRPTSICLGQDPTSENPRGEM